MPHNLPFEPPVEIPFYYPCNLPIIREVLRREGCESTLSLLAGARLYGLPSCSSTGLLKWYFNKLDYAESVWRIDGYGEMPSFEEGLARIRERVADNRLFIGLGASYYLPYFEDYLNPKYIARLTDPDSLEYPVDHWLSIYGADEDRLHIYDPVPAGYRGTLALDAFRDFWAGNASMRQLDGVKRKETLRVFGHVDVSAEAKLTSAGCREALRRTLATHAFEYLNASELQEGGRRYYFGHAVTLLLLGQLHLGDDAPGADGKLTAFLFNMRWSRYYLLDMLQDLASMSEPGAAAWHAEFDGIFKGWEQAHKRMVAAAGRGAGKAEATRFVRDLADREYRFYEALWAGTRDAGLLPKNPKNEAASARGVREEVSQIVLASCGELNRYHNGRIAMELGEQAPLYGRYGTLDSLALVTLLAVAEQGVLEKLGVDVRLDAGEALSSARQPFRTVESLSDYIAERLGDGRGAADMERPAG